MSKKGDIHVTLNNRVLLALIESAPDEAEKVLRKIGQEGDNYVKLSMGTSPPGRTHVRGGISHIASVEGYPPNVDTGTLRAGIGNEPRGNFKHAITSSAEYGEYVEFGGTRTGARPFMRPMAEWLFKQMDQFYKDFI
jgi:hypothetical protein